MTLAASLQQLIREQRRSPPFVFMARACEKYLRAWHNEGFWRFSSNGEAWALHRFAAWWGDKPAVVWDVGCNAGDWALVAHEALKSATVTGFEMVSPVFERMASRLANESWFTPVCQGLSNTAGQAVVTWNRSEDMTSSIHPRLEHRLFRRSEIAEISCTLTTGDIYAGTHPPPDLLKIDTEGHETHVLRGCESLLRSEHAPSMIQFEYGDTYLPSGSNLKQIYELLSPLDYNIGRLYPNHVEFKDYAYEDDHFRMGNYIAVRSGALKALLS